MNEQGNPETLVGSHPGNGNAVKQGVHSPRLIQARAAELEAGLARSLELSAVQRLALQEVARCMAILEAIDRDLDERGLVDKAGKPRYLLNHRSRISRQLDQWLAKIPDVIGKTAAAEESQPVVGERADYVRALQRIALGHDQTASARDRLAALKELLKLEHKGTSSYIDGPSEDDPELRRRWAEAHRADSLQRLESVVSRLSEDG
jgi:hypothetical protein